MEETSSTPKKYVEQQLSWRQVFGVSSKAKQKYVSL